MDAVVVSHNSCPDLAGLLACWPLREAFDRVIVVDNASSDDSRAVADDGGAKVLARPANTGFGDAANAGAQLTDGDVFALLNPDIRLADADAVEKAHEGFEDPRVGLIGPRLVLPDGTTQDSARVVPTPLGIVRRRSGDAKYGGIVCRSPCDVPWVVGAAMFVRRAAFEAVGGFDPRYFLYFEDVDLCVRLHRDGWFVRYDPTLEFEHHHRAESRERLDSWATRRHIKSASRFFARNPRFLAFNQTPD